MPWPPTEDVPEKSTGVYRTGKKCQTCGIEQTQEHFQRCEAGFGWRHRMVFSCSHYEAEVRESPCKYCGKKNTPVRQVPAPVPFSDCYCDDCAGRCGEEYGKLLEGLK